MEDDFVKRYRRNVANELRNAYILERTSFETRLGTRAVGHVYYPSPAFDGGLDEDGKRHKRLWPRLALKVIKACLSPSQFIRAQFAGKHTYSPMPGHLISDKAIRRAKNFQKADRTTIHVAFVGQLRTWSLEVLDAKDFYTWPDPVIWAFVLENESIALSSLFRYCQACSLKFKNMRPIRDTYRVRAFAQYLRNPASYDEVWGDALPEGFKADAMDFGKKLGFVSED